MVYFLLFALVYPTSLLSSHHLLLQSNHHTRAVCGAFPLCPVSAVNQLCFVFTLPICVTELLDRDILSSSFLFLLALCSSTPANSSRVAGLPLVCILPIHVRQLVACDISSSSLFLLGLSQHTTGFMFRGLPSSPLFLSPFFQRGQFFEILPPCFQRYRQLTASWCTFFECTRHKRLQTGT